MKNDAIGGGLPRVQISTVDSGQTQLRNEVRFALRTQADEEDAMIDLD